MGSEKTGVHTERKQSDYAAFITMHMKMVQSIQSRKAWADPVYHYYDMNAGSGIVNGDDGSPIIFAKQARSLEIRSRALLFEECADSAANLRQNLRDYDSLCQQFSVIEGDHSHTLLPHLKDDICRQPFGLMYFDPNGNVPPFELIRSACKARSMKNVDMLINLAATTVKRARMAFPDKYDDLASTLPSLGKRHVLVRRPLHRHQWTFVLLTNWAKFPAMERRGIYRLDSDCGREAMMRISMTAKEIENVFTGELPL